MNFGIASHRHFLTRLSIKSGPDFLKNGELHIWFVNDDLDLFHHFSMLFLAPFCKDFGIRTFFDSLNSMCEPHGCEGTYS